MTTSQTIRDGRVASVACTDDRLEVELRDGRRISVPLDWYPRLKSATPAERATWEPGGAGHGIHWPLIDEDLSVEGLLRGAPAPKRKG